MAQTLISFGAALKSVYKTGRSVSSISEVLEGVMGGPLLREYGLVFMLADNSVLSWDRTRDEYRAVLYCPALNEARRVAAGDRWVELMEYPYTQVRITGQFLHAVSMNEGRFADELNREVRAAAKAFWPMVYPDKTGKQYPGHDEPIQARHLLYRQGHGW